MMGIPMMGSGGGGSSVSLRITPSKQIAPRKIKERYRYIHFEKYNIGAEHPGWDCYNTKHGDKLGDVTWATGWKQYVFCPSPSCDFSASCLDDISHFLKQLNGGDK